MSQIANNRYLTKAAIYVSGAPNNALCTTALGKRKRRQAKPIDKDVMYDTMRELQELVHRQMQAYGDVTIVSIEQQTVFEPEVVESTTTHRQTEDGAGVNLWQKWLWMFISISVALIVIVLVVIALRICVVRCNRDVDTRASKEVYENQAYQKY